jgi:V-type H+-transporting ATPase subunit H
MVHALESDVDVFRVLINLLNNAQEPVVLAVAAHDIGQYVKHYDRGKK